MRGEHNELPSPSRAYQATTDRNDADMPPPRHVPAPACAASPTARIMSMLPCPPRLHALRCHPPHSCMHASLCSLHWHTTCLYVFLFLISTNFLFCGPVTT